MKQEIQEITDIYENKDIWQLTIEPGSIFYVGIYSMNMYIF